MKSENLITVEQYAKKKKVATMTVYRWIKANKIKSVQIGKLTLIDLSKN